MKRKLLLLILFLPILFRVCSAQKQQTFTNPLLPSGADPYSFYKNGYYYYTNTLQDSLVLWKTKTLADLKTAEHKTIWVPPAGTAYSKEIWAPEFHFIKGKWYAYFAADDGNNNHHRTYVLENASADPFKGKWVFKGKVAAPSDKWSIDSDVFFQNGQQFMVWAGWEGDVNGQQNIYIAKMKNPLTISGKRVKISSPQYSWEENGDLHDPNNPPHVNVNEGPQYLKHGHKIFIIYSASGCWTDFYALGMLTASAKSNLLNPASWKKSPKPVFKQSPENGVYAPGHNSFFKSPDGTEDWILYHANSEPNQGCGRDRSPRAQKFTWTKTGMPYFGLPVKTGVPIPIPSEKKIKKHR
ncbi:glycoside hydrolase family 43 protein [Mucilaginibacter arboris]|uniref:Family 43 glycosylhydrolase n=1 Tax=Mucilaginibacter arboris TaxID=2682090 RepID=A0A7K1SUY5_9SPHI|nr:glycoside hydrolase family 43 protein [Mucilaginibacter arboris]MVN21067.1 family 43 glycosylhydrolase [Mucilaginibacter arboris]